MYQNILVPTDGSRAMDRVVGEAIGLAQLSGARVHALHAVDDAAYAAIPADARERVRDRLAEDGEDATRTVAQRAVDAGVEVRREVRWGPPPHAIVSFAVENDVDLIVMGTHGRTGYERYLLGSVAERVVRSAPMPVLTVDVDGETDALDVIRNGTSEGGGLAPTDETEDDRPDESPGGEER